MAPARCGTLAAECRHRQGLTLWLAGQRLLPFESGQPEFELVDPVPEDLKLGKRRAGARWSST